MNTTPTRRPRDRAVAATLLLGLCAGIAAAQPPRILDAADHAEIAAGMASDGVVRVALLNDRIARVIRAPGQFAVEHDPAAGDLYLRPTAEHAPPESDAPPMPGVPHGPAGLVPPVSLFIGSERGSTYRLTLTPAAGGPAQILIRGVDPEPGDEPQRPTESDRVADIAGLIRAVANGEPPAGYAVEPVGRGAGSGDGIVPLEAWRGPNREALVLALGADVPADAPALAERLGPDVVAVWIESAGTGPAVGGSASTRFAAGRLAVVVRGSDPR